MKILMYVVLMLDSRFSKLQSKGTFEGKKALFLCNPEDEKGFQQDDLCLCAVTEVVDRTSDPIRLMVQPLVVIKKGWVHTMSFVRCGSQFINTTTEGVYFINCIADESFKPAQGHERAEWQVKINGPFTFDVATKVISIGVFPYKRANAMRRENESFFPPYLSHFSRAS